MHTKGLYHGDLKPENILVKVSYLSDTTKIGKHPWFFIKKDALCYAFQSSSEYAELSFKQKQKLDRLIEAQQE